MIKTNFSVLMAERGLKIADVYEDTGISKTTLMALAENTGKGVQFETVDKLCIYLGVELKDFFIFTPYIWQYHYKKGDLNGGGDYIIINVKSNKGVKKFYLAVYFKDTQSSEFPLVDESVKAWASIYLDSDRGDTSAEFFAFLSELNTTMYSMFIREVINLIVEKILHDGKEILFFSEQKQESYILKKGDKVYLTIFNGDRFSDNSKFETAKTVTI